MSSNRKLFNPNVVKDLMNLRVNCITIGAACGIRFRALIVHEMEITVPGHVEKPLQKVGRLPPLPD